VVKGTALNGKGDGGEKKKLEGGLRELVRAM